MTIPEALAVASMRSVDLWKLCTRDERGNYRDTPDSLREQALDVLAAAWVEREGQTCDSCRRWRQLLPEWNGACGVGCGITSARFGCTSWQKRKDTAPISDAEDDGLQHDTRGERRGER